MENVKRLQVPIILLLLTLLAIAFFKYQNVEKENHILKLRLAESLQTVDTHSNENSVIKINGGNRYSNYVSHGSEVCNSKVDLNSVQQTNSATEPKIIQSVSKQLPFDEQEIDYEWATFTETAVNDVFYTSSLLTDFELESVECRTSTCRIRMPQQHQDSIHQADLVLAALEEVGISYNTKSFSSDTKEGRVEFYFNKLE